jgi:hypothetical protein
VRDPGGLKVEVGDQGVVRATRGSSTRLEQSRGRRLVRGGDALPLEAWRKRSASATWRARASAVVRSCSQARAATRTRSSTAAAAVLVFSRAASRALSGGRDGGGTRRHPAKKGGGGEGEKGLGAGGMP